MVDLDKLKDKKNSGKSKGNSGSSKSNQTKSTSSGTKSQGSSSGSPSGDTEPYSMGQDEMMDPEGKQIGQMAKDWAEDGAEFGHDKGTGGSFSQYAQAQVKEVQELHDNVVEMMEGNMDNFDEFTLYFHALMFNLAQNRVKIRGKIEEEFGVSEREATQKTRKICERAGEAEMVEDVLDTMTENMDG